MAVVGKICVVCKNFIPNSVKNHTCQRNVLSNSFECNILRKIYTEIEEVGINDTEECENTVLTQKSIDGLISTQHAQDFTFEQVLISCLQDRRPLWDYKMPVNQRSKGIKNKIWSEIHKELNYKYDIKTLESKWKYLKEEYTRRKNSKKSGSGSSKEWHHMRQLRFLDDIVTYKPTTSNVNEHSFTALESDSPDVPPLAETIKKRSSQDNIAILLNELKSTRPKTPPPPPATTNDEKFCDYLCSIMEHLPKAKKLKLQAKFINDVLNESEI